MRKIKAPSLTNTKKRKVATRTRVYTFETDFPSRRRLVSIFVTAAVINIRFKTNVFSSFDSNPLHQQPRCTKRTVSQWSFSIACVRFHGSSSGVILFIGKKRSRGSWCPTQHNLVLRKTLRYGSGFAYFDLLLFGNLKHNCSVHVRTAEKIS